MNAPAGILPCSVQAERALIGSVFVRPSLFFGLSEVIGPDDLMMPVNQSIWDTMVSVSGRGMEVDPVSVGDRMAALGQLSKLPGGLDYLMTLASEGFPDRARQYAALVLDAAVRRQIVYVCAEHGSRACGDKTARQAVDDLREAAIYMLSRQRAIEMWVKNIT